MKTKPKQWGKNKEGVILSEGDKIFCGKGYDTWYTHVQFDEENNSWHREDDYFNSEKVGHYIPCEDWGLTSEEWEEHAKAASWLVNKRV